MRLEFTLAGVSPIIMHNGASGLDTRSALSLQIAAIAAKRGGNRTDVDDRRLRELECQRSLYLDADGRPTVPEAALRAMIEASARGFDVSCSDFADMVALRILVLRLKR